MTTATKLNFDIKAIIDMEGGISQIGEAESFYNMMEGFEEMTLFKNMQNFKEFYDINDEKKFKDEAHTLKGASSYLAAGRVYNLCAKIQDAHTHKQYEEEFSYYPQLMEEIVILRIEIKKIISKRKGKLLKRCSIH